MASPNYEVVSNIVFVIHLFFYLIIVCSPISYSRSEIFLFDFLSWYSSSTIQWFLSFSPSEIQIYDRRLILCSGFQIICLFFIRQLFVLIFCAQTNKHMFMTLKYAKQKRANRQKEKNWCRTHHHFAWWDIFVLFFVQFDERLS